MHYNSAGDQLRSIECIQDNASMISVFVPSDLAESAATIFERGG
jgi:hypothetical protein